MLNPKYVQMRKGTVLNEVIPLSAKFNSFQLLNIEEPAIRLALLYSTISVLNPTYPNIPFTNSFL